jgi:excisionase family DNA binding protein
MQKIKKQDTGDDDSRGVPVLLTVEEARMELRISRSSFYRLVQQRQIVTIRIRRRRFVPASAITTFIQRRSEETA